MKIKAFITHKKAEFFDDCQDRFSLNKETKSIAVSDGMSQSWHQKKWAELLVSAYTDNCQWTPNLDSVRTLCAKWKEWVESYIEGLRERVNAGDNRAMHILYRNERNLNNGNSAGATLVGIRFTDNKWCCDVLGDSCLIEKNPNGTFEFRTSQEGEFDNYPDYYDSNPQKTGKGIFKYFNGELNEKSNLLLLVSDPLSDHLLEHKKRDCLNEKINELQKISSHEDFKNLVSKWRNEGMHNDDTTLIIIEYDGSNEFNIEWKDDIDELSKINNGTDDPPTKVIEKPNQPIETQSEEKENNQISDEEFIKQAKSIFRKLRRIEENKSFVKRILDCLKKEDARNSEEFLNEFLRRLYEEFIILKK